jgi:hypothetical protein
VGPADRQQLVVVPAQRGASEALAPLPGARVVAHELAGEDQIAAREADREVLAHLARGGSDGRLVQSSHALGDLALADAREPLERKGGHLKIHVIELAAPRARLAAALARERRVARERERRLAQQQPATLAGRSFALKQAAGSRQPAIADRRLPAEDAVIPGQRVRDARGVDRAPGLPIARIGAFARGEHERHVVQVPGGRRQPLERLRPRRGRERALKGRTRLFPCATLQSRLAGGEPITAGVDGRLRAR